MGLQRCPLIDLQMDRAGPSTAYRCCAEHRRVVSQATILGWTLAAGLAVLAAWLVVRADDIIFVGEIMDGPRRNGLTLGVVAGIVQGIVGGWITLFPPQANIMTIAPREMRGPPGLPGMWTPGATGVELPFRHGRAAARRPDDLSTSSSISGSGFPPVQTRDGLIVMGRMGGVAGGLFNGLGDTMDELGLPAPSITTSRARFYFTEIGWRRVGLAVAADARRRGHVIRVVRRKRPRPSQIVYRDLLQVAILPDRRMVGRTLSVPPGPRRRDRWQDQARRTCLIEEP